MSPELKKVTKWLNPPPGPRLLICGSRTYGWLNVEKQEVDQPAVDKMFNMLDAGDKKYGFSKVIQGEATGADLFGKQWAEGRLISTEDYPARWSEYGKRAGYLRNQQMLDEGKPDLVICFVDKPLSTSRGSAMMCSLAEKAGLKVIVPYHDDRQP